eukprot:360424-Chlamydomonas_euryale.AAC.3
MEKQSGEESKRGAFGLVSLLLRSRISCAHGLHAFIFTTPQEHSTPQTSVPHPHSLRLGHTPGNTPLLTGLCSCFAPSLFQYSTSRVKEKALLRPCSNRAPREKRKRRLCSVLVPTEHLERGRVGLHASIHAWLVPLAQKPHRWVPPARQHLISHPTHPTLRTCHAPHSTHSTLTTHTSRPGLCKSIAYV